MISRSLPEAGRYNIQTLSLNSLSRCSGSIEVEGDGKITLNLENSAFEPLPNFNFQSLNLTPVQNKEIVTFWTDLTDSGGLLIQGESSQTGFLRHLGRHEGQMIVGFGDSDSGQYQTPAFATSARELAQIILENVKTCPIEKGKHSIQICLASGLEGTLSYHSRGLSLNDLKQLKKIAEGSPALKDDPSAH